ncbi:formylmethanofuran dehydrogenase subunit C [Paraburkholderia caballeronis]|uniref:formylmethanofuran dehydrogenase subunit C n=1 Tax=Paraburkholderia caballeronis TaxID=416943 RepID=UPI0010651268|nr:formylmethanofuran dehydrogenase subunit C [Paraburkholderia caballeronis]TDV19522.1 formylmethanofuran dehydrogenase subunit C [Paraburkholderia caballeronis]TDV22122.1 formylmethanofuran dehydrogenase subunit C [Paraburkholderia caballeronis]TDV29026.1 formylmethanofuran dehydrogenase subunit C [Paraburkholderia caballeronis]
MSTTTLRARTTPESRVDASALLPAALAGLAVADVERLTLPAGNDAYRVGDLFDVSRTDAAAGSEAGPTLAIEAAGAWLDRIGARMETGRLIVRGAAGDYAGLRMTGGTLAIEGDAGGFAGCEMRGGRLDVAGNSGDFAAGALPGDMEGMTGGTLTIRGHAGARLADRMRRGLVLVGGDAGPFAATRLVAGTVGIAGAPGAHYAYGMRRGTLLLAREPASLPPTFSEGGRGFEVFWALLARSLADEIEPFSSWRTPPRARLTGDLAVDGRGEILIAG